MERVRSLDEFSYASCGGFSNTSGYILSRYYALTPYRVLGRKKVTVDNPRPLRDYRYDMIPKVAVRRYKRIRYLKSTYRGHKAVHSGRRVKSFVERKYVRYVSIKRPKVSGLEGNTGLVRLNNFNVAQVLGYSTVGILQTPTLPKGWTTWYLTGPFAVEGFKDPSVQPVIGFDPFDLSRPLSLDLSYASSALARSVAKVTEPTVDFAEIIGELDQLVHLVEDPFKTLGGLLRKFQRLYSCDSWMVPAKALGLQRTLSQAEMRRLLALRPEALAQTLIGSGTLRLFTLRTRRKVGRRKVANAVVVEAANRWLQYRYGIMPLVSDVGAILQAFQENIKKRLAKIYTAKTTVVAKRTSRTWLTTRASAVPGFTLTYRIKISTFDRYTAKVFYRLNTYDKFLDLQDLGLDTSNLVPVMWELLPWSFIVDWFYGVGDWFRSWNRDPKLVIVGNCVSRKRDINVKISIISATYNGYSCQVPRSSYYLHRAELCRKVNLPVPEYPVFNPDFLKWRRVLDTFSLLWAKMPFLRR